VDRQLGGAPAGVQDVTAARAAGLAWIADAEAATQAWIHEKRRDGVRAIDKELLAVVEQAYALALKREAFAAETTRLAMTRDGADLGYPFPVLTTWGETIEKGRRLLAPPSDPPATPVPPGLVRVRVVETLRDPEWMARRYPGVADIDEKSAHEAIEKGWAVPA
jgi:hypothetical protein